MFARHASGPQEDSDPEDDGDFERDNDDDDFNEIDTPSPALCPTLRSPPKARPKPIILSLACERWHPAPTLPTSPKPGPLVDEDHYVFGVFGVFGGQPRNPKWATDVAHKAALLMEEAAEHMYGCVLSGGFRRLRKQHDWRRVRRAGWRDSRCIASGTYERRVFELGLFCTMGESVFDSNLDHHHADSHSNFHRQIGPKPSLKLSWMAHERRIQHRQPTQRSPATMAARQQASARYRQKNLDEEREKARERMARLREKVLRQEGRGAAFFERAREASRKHREKNAAALAHRQRILRLKAYDRKHGHHAWLERHNLREERRAAAQEAPLSNDDPQEDMVETGWYPKI
ncbi:hypothetical protein DFH08DRAFT_805388 [Mycena albidolilacea]|uniref:Uncharacterized protein n=1 Tax=Mycena albidolilacea TaxID=1033008 RepID=A0AAD7EU35_9AGAR|nr:hypothetical protein DFH08DRAFT_805388 [Mycena albidolilacea]